MLRLLLLALLLAGCAPRSPADPLLLAYDLANETALAIDEAVERHEADLEADLDRRFAHCRRAYEGEDPRPCFRVQAGLAQAAAADEAGVLVRIGGYHREALRRLREARACRQASQACEGPARDAASELLAKAKAGLTILPLPKASAPPVPPVASPNARAL